MVRRRRRHTAACKIRVALKALEGSKTISQLSSEHYIHADLIYAWKLQFLDNGPKVFASKDERNQLESRESELCRQVQRLKTEVEWLKSKATGSGHSGPLRGQIPPVPQKTQTGNTPKQASRPIGLPLP